MSEGMISVWSPSEVETYSFLIGSADDFSSIKELIEHFREKGEHLNASRFDFDVPEFTDDETITMIGRGMAFSNDWCMDHTLSVVTNPLVLD